MRQKFTKIIHSLGRVTPAVSVFFICFSATAFAAPADTVTKCTKATFFGLIPWYQYLQLDSNCDIKSFMLLPDGNNHSDVPLVALAVIDDLLRIAGIVAVGYIIYGGIRYIISQGNPDATGKARQTILNALIGLVIALVAVSVVSFIGNKLGG